MRTEQARPVRLHDYSPPDWLVDTVELDVSLHPTATRVRARLALRPNTDSGNQTSGNESSRADFLRCHRGSFIAARQFCTGG